MGCCNSLRFDGKDVEFALDSGPVEKSADQDQEGFADVSLGSHSESNTSQVQETHPVFLMNSAALPGLFFLSKERSITISGDVVETHGLEGELHFQNLSRTPKFGGGKINSRSASYTSGQKGPLEKFFVNGKDPGASTKESGTSSFREDGTRK